MVPGKLIGGRYEVIDTLGEGGMAFVLSCRDTELGRTVALKVIQSKLARQPEALSRFKREMRAVASLSHPNVISVFDHGILPDGRPYFVMEYLPCPALDEYLSDRSLDETEILALARSMAEGLRHVHHQGVVHRDLKPGNVLVPGKGEAKIVDFGLAHVDDATRCTRTGAIMGTPRYLSPEQFHEAKVDARSDIFQFGAIVHEMLTGEPAFAGERLEDIAVAIIKGRRCPIPDEGRRYHWLAFLDRCLAPAPGKRYQTMAAVIQGLDEVARRLSDPAPPSTAETATVATRPTDGVVPTRGRGSWPAALVCSLVVVACVLLLFRRSPDSAADLAVLGVRLSGADQAVIQHQPALSGELSLAFQPDAPGAATVPAEPLAKPGGADRLGGSASTAMRFSGPLTGSGTFVVTDRRTTHVWRFRLPIDDVVDRLLGPLDALPEDRFRDLVVSMTEDRSAIGRREGLSDDARAERVVAASLHRLERAGLSPSWVSSLSTALPRLITAAEYPDSPLARRLFRVRVLENVAGYEQRPPLPWGSANSLLRFTNRRQADVRADEPTLARRSFGPRPRWLAPRHVVDTQRSSSLTTRLFWVSLMGKLMQAYDPRPDDAPPSADDLDHAVVVDLDLPADAVAGALEVHIDARLFTRTLYLELTVGDRPPVAVFNMMPGPGRESAPTSGMHRNVIGVPVSPGCFAPGPNRLRLTVEESPGDEPSTALALYGLSVTRGVPAARTGR